MMKRRWSNNGGFALRMLEESSSEVTSSSAALVMSPGMTMSPTSLSSPEYNELELWGYEENSYSHHGIVANNGNANNVSAGGGGGNMGNGGNGGVVISNNGALTVVANNGAVTVVANGLAGVNGGVLAANLLNAGNGGSNNTLNNLALGNCILGAGNGGNGGGGGGGGGVGIQGSQNMISTPLPSIIQNSMMNNNTPRSESANSISSGREDLSPSSSLNGYTPDGVEAKKPKKGPAPRQQEELCLVCGDRASGYHYNALTCEGCKGFFRRSVTKNAVYCCKFGHECEMDMYMRRKCQECRLKKCLAVGMRPECVVPENQCAIKRKEKKAQKEKDKQTNNNSVSTTNNSYKIDILPQLMKCDPPPHAALALLPEKLLNENRSRNIPQLTANQMAVIYKLIWYQDGYEQPSEEDLKRIMINSPGDEEDQHDVHFRHITEITILTVQLIVEFAKGLPAFTKIPQEDQITLLKACSSEVMMLRMARRYDAASDSILFANNRSYTRDSYRMAGMAETIEDLLHFCRQMYSMTVDNVEYALLTAIVIFSDRPGLEQADLVEQIQSYYIETLKIYIVNRHGGDTKCGVLFAKLLSILTELRTLGNQNSEMCFSLKLKNRKLPRFLEEIWDVQDVSTNIQASNIIATAASPTPQQQQQQQTIQVVPNPNMINSSNNSNINSNINNSSGTGSIGGGGSASGNTLIIGNNNNSNSNNSSSNIVVSGVSVVTSQSSSSSSSVSSQNEQQHV